MSDDHPRPHPTALQRHERACQNETLHDFAALHALAGRYDAYPVHQPQPWACPICQGATQPGRAYCSDACRLVAGKRLGALSRRRAELDEIAPYNW